MFSSVQINLPNVHPTRGALADLIYSWHFSPVVPYVGSLSGRRIGKHSGWKSDMTTPQHLILDPSTPKI